MGNLVKRLRDPKNWTKMPHHPLMTEAAAEVERLLAIIAEAPHHPDCEAHREWCEPPCLAPDEDCDCWKSKAKTP